MDIIQAQNSLKTSIKSSQIKNIIVERISKFEGLESYKLDIEFLKLVCNMIEFQVKKKYGIDKQDLLLKIYETVFNLSIEDKDTVKKNIEFIFQNDHIQKVSFYKLFVCGLSEWIKKKIF